MTVSYRGFAPVYDILMSDHPYAARAEYLLGLFRKWDSEPKLMLDLACGSGRLTLELLRRGVDVIGVDPSEEMLMLAGKRMAAEGRSCLLLCQSGEQLDLYGTVDSAICTLDSINHVVEESDLLALLFRVHLFLEPNGLFLFDVNTEFKHQNVLGNNTYVFDRDDVYCVWRNATRMPMTTVMLDYFVKHGEDYVRGSEEFEERAWSEDELERLLHQAGFTVEARYEDMTRRAPSAATERVQYVTRRV